MRRRLGEAIVSAIVGFLMFGGWLWIVLALTKGCTS
jgi:hypothetical protein